MPLMENPKSSADILRDILDRIALEHDVDLYPGALAHTIAMACSEEIGDLYDLLSAENTMSVLPTSTGRHLNLIGQLLGCYRLSQEPTYASTSDYIVSLPVGMTGANFGGTLTVPSGTRVTTDPALGDVIEFQLLEPAIFGPGDNTVSVAIRAVQAGPDSNVESNTLVRIAYSGTPLSGSNPTAISNGQAAETDDNYRYRISQQILVLEGANATKVRLAALAVPGVRDVILKPFVKGPGSFLIYVVGSDFGEDSPVLQEVRAAVDAAKGFAMTSLVLTPDAKGVRLGLFLTMRNREQQFVDQATRLACLAAVRGVFDRYLPGETLSLEEITRAVERAAPNVYRASINAIEIDGRAALLKNHTLNWDERWRLMGVDIV